MPMSVACVPDHHGSVRVEGDLDSSVALITVAGAWDRRLRHLVLTALQKCLAEHPDAVIVDLSGLDDPDAGSATTWVGVRGQAAAMEPPVQMALCIPPDLPLADRMQRLGAPRFLPVYAKVRQARVAIASRLPLTERVQLTLGHEAEAPSMARNLVGDACLAWGLPELLHPGRLVMSELVTNAHEHAPGEIAVVVSRRGLMIHLSVADRSAAPPRLLKLARPRRGRPLDERGRGLHVVAAMSVTWGWLPTRTGKVVWATVQARPGATAPR